MDNTEEFISFITKISKELDLEVSEYYGDIKKMDDEQRVMMLMDYSPIIRHIYIMHMHGHIDYEDALQRMVIELFNAKNHYKNQLEDLLMRTPSTVLIPGLNPRE